MNRLDWVRRAGPYAVFAATVVVVIGLLWVLPATQSSPTTTSVAGREWEFTWEGSEEREMVLEWTYPVVLGKKANDVHYDVRVPLNIWGDKSAGSGEAWLKLDGTVFVNDKNASYMFDGMYLRESSPGGRLGSTSFFPDWPIEQGLLHEGNNTIRLHVVFTLNVYSPGPQTFEVTIGPMDVELFYGDGDHDGIPDAYQWSPVHTGIPVIPLAIGFGALTVWASNRYWMRDVSMVDEQ